MGPTSQNRSRRLQDAAVLDGKAIRHGPIALDPPPDHQAPGKNDTDQKKIPVHPLLLQQLHRIYWAACEGEGVSPLWADEICSSPRHTHTQATEDLRLVLSFS